MCDGVAAALANDDEVKVAAFFFSIPLQSEQRANVNPGRKVQAVYTGLQSILARRRRSLPASSC